MQVRGTGLRPAGCLMPAVAGRLVLATSATDVRTVPPVDLRIVEDELLVMTGDPVTVVGPGESCLLCDDPLPPGSVVVTARFCGSVGLVDQDCEHLAAPGTRGGAAESLLPPAAAGHGPAREILVSGPAPRGMPGWFVSYRCGCCDAAPQRSELPELCPGHRRGPVLTPTGQPFRRADHLLRWGHECPEVMDTGPATSATSAAGAKAGAGGHGR